MGNYNPHAPFNLGQEWGPIRDESVVFNPDVADTEIGHRFTIVGSRTPTQGGIFVHEPSATTGRTHGFGMQIYPAGTVDKSGPVHKVLIPVNNVSVTGTVSGVWPFLINAASYVDALFDASHGYIFFSEDAGETLQRIELNFAVNEYAQLLNNKRILNVSFAYSAENVNSVTPIPNVPYLIYQPKYVHLDFQQQVAYNFLNMQDNGQSTEVSRMSLGSMNPLWGAPTVKPSLSQEIMPWTYAGLQRFELSATNPVCFQLITDPPSGTGTGPTVGWRLMYAALEVTYCEEQRLVVGGFDATTAGDSWGLNTIPLRAANTLALSPTLPDGSYDVTICAADLGELNANSTGQVYANQGLGTGPRPSTFPFLNGLRQLGRLDPHPGVRVNLTQEEGQVFTSDEVDVLPQIALYGESGVTAPITEVHAYGRQAKAQVYGNLSATQEIADTAAGGSATWPQVKYIARRFGDTVVPLKLTIAGSSESITPAEFDVLDEIIDGWKTITLEFSTPPTMGALATPPQGVWTATGELPGNRWEVLGGVAPAVSGNPFTGDLLWQASSNFQVSPATYGWPLSGADINLAWMPGYAPPVSGTADDRTSDAYIVFAQTMLPITGFGVSVLSQAVTGIGQNCGVDPCCIPTAIQYNRLTWPLPVSTAVALDTFDRTVVNGFGTPDFNGSAYTLTAAASAYQVDLEGLITPPASGTQAIATFDLGVSNFDITAEVGSSITIPATTTARASLVGRYVDINNLLTAYVEQAANATTSTVGIQLTQLGIATVLAFNTRSLTINSGGRVNIRFMGQGKFLKAKAWPVGADEPPTWDVEINGIVYGLYLPGQSGSYASTPDAAALDIVGDIDIAADLTLDDWAPAGGGFIVSKWTDPAQLSYAFGVTATGKIFLFWTTGGTGGTGVFDESTVVVPLLSGRLSVRATLDVNNGGGGRTVTYYTGPTVNGPWTQLGATNGGAITSIFSGTSQMEVGTHNSGVSDILTGATIHQVIVKDGIAGTAVANPDFAAQTNGTTSFADAAGRTWTINTGLGGAQIITSDTAANGTRYGVAGRSTPLVGNTLAFDDFTFTPPSYWFGGYEIQRYDDVEVDWQTIMVATSTAVTGFNDFEARVGIPSHYRIRFLDALGFASPWSSTVTATVPEPGVTIGCEGGHLLIFTTNERQTGSSNLAYSSVWQEGRVVEDFAFPEAGFVQLQAMYDRDFVVAFRPMERGGERFSRTVLVQAAAIPPETLADFTSLRNMAWEDTSYICVRDEDGNRWLATVLVPSGRVLLNRRLYMAPVDIIEVTETPSPVDPPDIIEQVS